MGEFLALLTALLWAIGVILFKKSVSLVPPFALSLFKDCVALVLLAATSIVLGNALLLSISTRDFLTIFLSGALGIGISDTLFLMALSRLGASRTALVDCLYSPFIILFSILMLQETLAPLVAAGGVLILGSVLVSSQRKFGIEITRRRFWSGFALGAAAMATVSFAAVWVTPLLNRYPLSWLSTLRMAGGVAALALILPLHPDRKAVFAAFRPQAAWKWMFWGTFFGSYLSLLAWLAGFKYSQAGIVALLNQTSTVLIVVFAWLFLREPMTRLKLAAVGMAFAGAALVVL